MAPDPRQYPDPSAAPAAIARLHALAAASLQAATGQEAATSDDAIRATLAGMLAAGEGEQLSRAFALAPSGAVYRHLWRLLADRERAPPDHGALAGTIFAIPIIVVAAREGPSTDVVELSGVVPNVVQLADILRQHRALTGNQTFGLSNALVSADALSIAQMPMLQQWRRMVDVASSRTLVAAPLSISSGAERAYLRFLVGSAVAAPGVDLLREQGVGSWGIPFARALERQFAIAGLSLLALPRAPQPPLLAVAQGHAAHREVAAQLFASNAIRKLRAAVGEPAAVISVHRVGDHGGEVRLSLSSPFDPREAEGFRWPLQPLDRVEDVVKVLGDLMRDCRVGNLRIEPGIHPDRNPGTGLTLLFKVAAETRVGGALH